MLFVAFVILNVLCVGGIVAMKMKSRRQQNNQDQLWSQEDVEVMKEEEIEMENVKYNEQDDKYNNAFTEVKDYVDQVRRSNNRQVRRSSNR